MAVAAAAGRYAAALRAARAQVTPALAMLLAFQLISGVLVSPLFALFQIYVEHRLGRTTVFASDIRILFSVMGGLVALVGGAVSDVLGRKPAYLLAMTGVIAAGMLFLVHGRALMLALSVFGGLMFGLGAVAGQSYLMDSTPRAGLGLATAGYFMSGTLGNALGSTIAGRVARGLPDGYEVLGAAMVAGQVLLLAVAWRLLPPLPPPETPRSLKAVADGYWALLLRGDVWALLALRFLPTVYWGCATFLMPLLLFRLTGSERPAGDYTSVSLILAAVCQLSMGRLVDRTGTRVPVVAAIAVVTIASLGQGVFGLQPAALVAYGLLGAGAAWSLSVTMTSLIHALTTDETRARLLGITHMAWSAGFLVGTRLAGDLARDRDSPSAPLAFLICAAGCAVAVVCAEIVVRSARRRAST